MFSKLELPKDFPKDHSYHLLFVYTVYYTVYSKNKEIKIYTEKISTKMVIGYTDGYTARIFCILDFSDKFRYIRYTEKSFENNVSQCYGLFDSTGSY